MKGARGPCYRPPVVTWLLPAALAVLGVAAAGLSFRTGRLPPAPEGAALEASGAELASEVKERLGAAERRA